MNRLFPCLGHNELPGGSEYGGVLTPAVGLGEVLIERLKNKEIEFKVLH